MSTATLFHLGWRPKRLSRSPLFGATQVGGSGRQCVEVLFTTPCRAMPSRTSVRCFVGAMLCPRFGHAFQRSGVRWPQSSPEVLQSSPDRVGAVAAFPVRCELSCQALPSTSRSFAERLPLFCRALAVPYASPVAGRRPRTCRGLRTVKADACRRCEGPEQAAARRL